MRWSCLVGMLAGFGCGGQAAPPAEPTLLRVEDSLVTAGPLQLAFHVVPGGEPALLLEAADGDSSSWGEFPEALAARTGRRVISYDRAGFGKSPFPAVAFSIEDEIAAIFAGVHRVGATRIVPIAAGYGALVDLVYAKAHPEDVAGLVLVEPMTAEFVEVVGLPAVMATLPAPAAPATDRERAAARALTSFPALVNKLHGVRWAPQLPVVLVSGEAPPFSDPALADAWRKAHDALATTPGTTHVRGSTEPPAVLDAVQTVLGGPR